MRINDSIIMLNIKWGQDAIHPVLLKGENRLALVDTGFPGQLSLFREAVKLYGFTLPDITDIIITHQDLDHIGCAKDIKSEAPHVKILAHRKEAEYMSGEKLPIKLAARYEQIDSLPAEEREGLEALVSAFYARAVATDEPLHGGETLPFAGGTKILHVPGHTPGHICLYIPADGGTLITGDALNVSDSKLAGPNPSYTYDMPLALESLRPLTSLKINRAICYHGGIVEGDISARIAALTGQQ